MNKQGIFIIALLILSGCATTEFSCEDDGGLWIDNSCLRGTDDTFLACSDNSECEGYCYTVKHPKAISDYRANGLGVTGTCSSHELPITCAQTIENQQVVELCRE